MDEPTVGIDPQSRNHILETIKELNKQGTTIIYTSHYMEEVEFLCDRIYIMDEGVIIAEGTKDQLVELIHNERNIIIEYENKPNGIKDKIRNLDSVIELNQNDKTLILKSKADINLMRQIIEISNLNKMDIISVNVEKPNLEAVFLKLTGKALRD